MSETNITATTFRVPKHRRPCPVCQSGFTVHYTEQLDHGGFRNVIPSKDAQTQCRCLTCLHHWRESYYAD